MNKILGLTIDGPMKSLWMTSHTVPKVEYKSF